MKQPTKFVIVWHCPDEKRPILASTKQVRNILEKEYGIPTQVAKTSFLPKHLAIEVPLHHVKRASDICIETFGRTRHI